MIFYKINKDSIEIAILDEENECYRPAKYFLPLSQENVECGHYETYRVWENDHIRVRKLSHGLTKDDLKNQGFQLHIGKYDSDFQTAKEIAQGSRRHGRGNK